MKLSTHIMSSIIGVTLFALVSFGAIAITFIIDDYNKNHQWNSKQFSQEHEKSVDVTKQINEDFFNKKDLVTRLIITSIIIIWVAIWVSLILSSIINKRIKEKNLELNYQALHDDLTGLPNRLLLQDDLYHALLTAKKNNEELTLLVLDLDNFKEINDAFGHYCGDIALKTISKTIIESIIDAHTIARLGGDEFAIILSKTNHKDALPTIEKLLQAIKKPQLIQDTTIECKASLGISIYPTDGISPETLLKNAEIAMYHSKKTGCVYSFYNSDLNFNSVRLLKQKNELRKAINNDDISINFQPMIDQNTYDIVSVEALARWNHEEHGFISPEEFIHTAEQTGVIQELTLQVIRKALTNCKQWHEIGHNITIAINISTYCLQDQSFPEKLMQVVNEVGMSTNDIELEITESALMEDLGSAQEMLHQLHETGFSLAIDDFGTGYSSLAYLKDFPVNTLKIDKSFVFDMNTNSSNAAIVQTVISLAHNLNCNVIAEGVEDKQTLDHLQSLGNDIAQGYYFSKPIPAEQFIQWLNDSSWGPRAQSDSDITDLPTAENPSPA